MPSARIDARERLIVALDLPAVEDARALVNELDGVVEFFKIGLALQLAPGVQNLTESLIREGKKVFLDYKYYDIPETVKKAVARAAKLGISFLTIHGSRKLIRAAVEGRGESGLKLFTVTVLTSMEAADIAEMGYSPHTVEELVIARARQALEAGSDGVIASGREAEVIKSISGGKLLVVTPGIRPQAYPDDDQKRRTTPREAILAGADYLVVGRPVTEARNRRKEVENILEEMQCGLDVVTAAVAGS